MKYCRVCNKLYSSLFIFYLQHLYIACSKYCIRPSVLCLRLALQDVFQYHLDEAYG